MEDNTDCNESRVTVSRVKPRPGPWFAMANGIRNNVKLLQCNLPARWAFVCALDYCNEFRTDGLVVNEALPLILRGIPNVENTIPDTLVRFGLWEKCPEGYRVINYLDWQPSKEQIQAALANTAARVQRHRAKKRERKSSYSERGRKGWATRRSRGAEHGAEQVLSRPPALVPARVFDLTARIRAEGGAGV